MKLINNLVSFGISCLVGGSILKELTKDDIEFRNLERTLFCYSLIITFLIMGVILLIRCKT